jgi:hypothetical protein
MKIPLITFSGVEIDLMNFKPDHINLYDISISLARQNRYIGHTAIPWSVAHHLLLCATIADKLGMTTREIECCVLHDVEETWCQDVIYAIKKNFMMVSYDTMCERISDTVYDFFGLRAYHRMRDVKDKVHMVDQIAYHFESKTLKPAYKFDPNYWTMDQLRAIKKLELKSDEFKIPSELLNMTTTQVAQSLFEVLTVIHTQNNLGVEVAVN